jgi:lactoylglutathione lyase
MPMLGPAVIYVPDVSEALAFYQRAFAFETVLLNQDYGEVESDGQRLAFDSESTADEDGPPGGYRVNRASAEPAGMEVMVFSEAVDATLRRALDAGATLIAQPEPKSWGQTVAYLRDPWGILIAVGTPWPPARRRD